MQINQDCYYRHLLVNKGERPKKAKYVKINNNLKDIVKNIEKREAFEYLDAIANTYVFYK